MDSPRRSHRAASRTVHRQERASPYTRPSNNDSPHTPLPRNPSSGFSALLNSIGSFWRRSTNESPRNDLDEEGEEEEDMDQDPEPEAGTDALATPSGPPGGFGSISRYPMPTSPVDGRTRVRMADTDIPGPSTFNRRPLSYANADSAGATGTFPEFLHGIADRTAAPPDLTPKEIATELADFFAKKKGSTGFSLVELHGVQKLLDDLKAGAAAPETPVVLPAPAFRAGAPDRPSTSRSTPHLFDRSLPRRSRNRPAYVGAGFGGTSRLRGSKMEDPSEAAAEIAPTADGREAGVLPASNGPATLLSASTLRASMLRPTFDEAPELADAPPETLPFSASAFITNSDIQERLSFLRESRAKNVVQSVKDSNSPPKKGPSAAASLLLGVVASEKKESALVNPYQSRPGAVKPGSTKTTSEPKPTKSIPTPSAPAPAPPPPPPPSREPIMAFDLLDRPSEARAQPKPDNRSKPVGEYRLPTVPKQAGIAPTRDFFRPAESSTALPQSAAGSSKKDPKETALQPASSLESSRAAKRPQPSRSTPAPKQQEVVELLDSDDDEPQQAPPPKKAKSISKASTQPPSSAQPSSGPMVSSSKPASATGPMAAFNFGAAASQAGKSASDAQPFRSFGAPSSSGNVFQSTAFPSTFTAQASTPAFGPGFGGTPAQGNPTSATPSFNIFGGKPLQPSTSPTSLPPQSSNAAKPGSAFGGSAPLTFGDLASRAPKTSGVFGTAAGAATQKASQPSPAMDVDKLISSTSTPAFKFGGTPSSSVTQSAQKPVTNPSFGEPSSRVPYQKTSEPSGLPFETTRSQDSSAMALDDEAQPSGSGLSAASAFPAAQRAVTPTASSTRPGNVPITTTTSAFSSFVASSQSAPLLGSGPPRLSFGQPSASSSSLKAASVKADETVVSRGPSFGSSQQSVILPTSFASPSSVALQSSNPKADSPEHRAAPKGSLPMFVFDVSMIGIATEGDDRTTFFDPVALPTYPFADALKSISSSSTAAPKTKGPEAAKPFVPATSLSASTPAAFDWAAAGLQKPTASVGKKKCGTCGLATDASLPDCEVCGQPV